MTHEKRKKAMRIGAIAVLGVLFIVLAVVIGMRTRAFTEGIAAYVAEEASGALGVPVSIGRVEVTSFRSVRIADIRIQDRAQGRMVEAVTADVEVGVLRLFSSPVGAIETVTVDAPKVVLREREDGSFNITDLKPHDDGNGAFAGEVIIRNGAAEVHLLAGDLLAENVDAAVDFDDPYAPSIEGMLTLDGREVRFSAVCGSEEQTARVEAADVDLRPYLRYLPDDALPTGTTIEDGQLDAIDLTMRRVGKDLTLEGDMEITRAKMHILDTVVEDITAKAHFTGQEMQLFARGTASEQTAFLHGRIRYTEAEPSFNLVVRSAAFDPARVLTGLDYTGQASFLVSLYGTAAQPIVDGNVEIAEGFARGIRFTEAKAHVHFEGNRISLSSFSAQAFGGLLEGMGEMHVEDQRFHVRLKAEGIDAAALASLGEIDGVTGRVDADLMLHGQGADVERMSAYGTMQGHALAYAGVETSTAATSFYMAKGAVHFDYLGFTFADGGSLAIEGDASEQYVALSYYGSDMPLDLISTVPDSEMAGRLEISGRIEGSTDNPYVTADFQGREGKLFSQPFDRFTGRASGSLDGVELQDFSVEKGGKTTWYAKGSVGFVGDRRIRLQVDTVGARMEDIMALVAPDQPLTGNVDNIITVTGTLDNPHIVGYIHFYEGSYRGYFLTGMDGDYFYDNGVLRLQDFHIFSPLVDMDLNGTMTGENLDFAVTARDVDLDRMGSHLPYPVEGHGVFLGKITGTMSAPHFDGTLTADKLLLNGAQIDQVRGTLHYQDGTLRLTNWGFAQNAGQYKLDGTVSISNETLTGRLDVKNGDIAGLLSMANGKNDVVAGRLNGTIVMRGAWKNPTVDLNATLDQASVADYPITDAAVALQLADRKLYIRELHARQGAGILAAAGIVPLDGGVMQAQFSSQGIAAGMLSKALGSTLPVTGDIDLEMQFRGTLERPLVDASLKIENGSVAGGRFDTLTGLFWLSGNKLHLNQFLVQKTVGDALYTASAKGEVGIASLLSGGDWMASDDAIDLHFMLDNADLSLLPALSDHVEWALGPMDGRVDVSGTMAHPRMNGAVSFTGGAVKLKLLERPFRDMEGRVALDGNRMTLEKFQGALGDGTYQGTGYAVFREGGLQDYKLDVTADRLHVESAFYRGPFTAELHVLQEDFYGSALPQVSARINVENALISIPTIPTSDGELPHVILDVDVDLGRGVHFYSSQLYDMWLSGKAYYGGTTRHIAPAGIISVRKGNFTYNTKRFTIRHGEVAFNQVGSFLPSLSMQADTRVGKTRIFLGLEGPLAEMDVRMTSTPELSETEIMSLLTFDTTHADTADVTASLLNFGLSMTLLSSIEEAMRNTIGIDEFRIAGEYADSKRGTVEGESTNRDRVEYNVELGKYLHEKWMLRYKFGIGNPTQEYGVRYDINERFSAYTGHDGQNQSDIFGFEARIQF